MESSAEPKTIAKD